ncbi:MAG: thermonuclease family protein [Planctomycetaceae bacterium]|nr:thermonuclease family protein [Planctomycetaceae bacterium]
MRDVIRPLVLLLSLVVVVAQSAENPPAHSKPIVETFHAVVFSIADGDTVSVLRDKKPVRVRLEGIDAPERKQEHSNKATHALTKLVKDKEVQVDVLGTDQYGRLLAILRLDGRSVNEQLVADGWAWHFKKYNSDPQLAALEAQAREAKVGLWAHENAIPPWEYREIERAAVAARKADQAPLIVESKPPVKEQQEAAKSHWLNTSTNARHNSSCRWFGKTTRGRYCAAGEGKACGICGG